MRFRSGQNCWHVGEADRVAFLVDGEDYFRAFAEACEAAQRSIYIVGWDLDSRIRLRRGEAGDDETFGRFVDRLAHEKPQLHIYLLEWDFAMFYSLEREIWPLLSFDWKTHERVHFALDDEHPVGASHHQKIVVVDDRLAFVGGFDLAICRWDTSDHAPSHPERIDNDSRYGPFHDMQMMVDGEPAAKLAVLARQRWERATGDRLSAEVGQGPDPWPEHVDVDLEGAEVAILRTEPQFDGRAEIREIEKFYLDAIAQANRFIYIENQYLTSHVIGDQLAKSLQQENGPDILIVLPRKCSGWLEQETMGALRQRILTQLHEADQHRRLKICFPDRAGLGSDIINVHSKLMIVDDRLLTIGSANLSNRSMGFDTECNLVLSAQDRDSVADAIAQLRNRLLAEHLDTDPDSVADQLQKNGSLLQVVDVLGSDQRSLQPLPRDEGDANLQTLSASEVADPERPLDMEDLLDHLGITSEHDQKPSSVRRKAWRFIGVIAVACLLAALWRWSPLGRWLNMDTLLAAADFVRGSVMTIPIVLIIYVIGSCLMFPITLMILATALSFGSVTGFALAFCGSLLGGLVSYLLGRWLGRDAVRKLAGDRLNRVSRKLARRGWLAVAIIRVVPIAPFTIVNLVAGASHISARSFLIGTAIGMGPGILAIMVFESGLEQAVRDPNWASIGLAVVALIAAAGVLFSGKRWLLGRKDKQDG